MKNRCVLALDMQRNITEGSPEKLRAAIKNAADLRIYTEFRHNEHIDTASLNNEMIREVSDFPATYLIDDRWVAGHMTFRQPVELPGFFGKPSMSFFMYNENGQQAIARPYLNHAGEIETGDVAPQVIWPRGEEKPMANMHIQNEFDADTNAPCSNFIYDFYSYKFMVQDDWKEVLSHDADGNVISGSAKALDEASSAGCDIKVAITGICDGLFGEKQNLKHELFVQTGPHYYYDEARYMVVETRPFVRVKPAIPMVYESRNWDFGWAIARSDGHVAGLFYDPYTLKFRKTYQKCAMRWFVRDK